MVKTDYSRNDLLILDFDGVIVNSIEECLVVGYNAAMEFLGERGRIERLANLPPQQASQLRFLRNFIRTGEDYVYICLANQWGKIINNQNEFDQFINEHIDIQQNLRTLFYSHRKTLLENKPDLWLELNPLYPGMGDFLKVHELNPTTFILTTKLSEYVHIILSHAKIKFPQHRIISVTKGQEKILVLQKLAEQFKIKSEELYFVDDQLDTLVRAKFLNINLFLAKWGYVNENQITEAIKFSIPVITLEEFYSLFNLPSPR